MEVVNALITQLNNEYGYNVKMVTDYLWILAHKNILNKLLNLMLTFSCKKFILLKWFQNTPVSNLETELENTIQYFESLEKKYTGF